MNTHTTTPADRARLVRERDKLRAEGDAACAKLAAKYYQAEHDADRAKEAMEKAQRLAGVAKNEWTGHSRSIEYGCNAIDAELEATAPLAIDAALADVAMLKDRYRNVFSPVLTIRMSDGTRQPDPQSLREHDFVTRRWQVFLDAEKELLALKLEALTDDQLAKKLDAIRARIEASIQFEQVAA